MYMNGNGLRWTEPLEGLNLQWKKCYTTQMTHNSIAPPYEKKKPFDSISNAALLNRTSLYVLISSIEVIALAQGHSLVSYPMIKHGHSRTLCLWSEDQFQLWHIPAFSNALWNFWLFFQPWVSLEKLAWGTIPNSLRRYLKVHYPIKELELSGAFSRFFIFSLTKTITP
jgi:hypothetical protein